MFLKSLYLNFFLWDEIKIPIQYGRIMKKAKEIILRGVEVAGT
jgi:hypothetical protein